MRLWSIHPKYLDQKGLIACWREGLATKAVLEEQSEVCKNHPQLERFKEAEKPLAQINAYLYFLLQEALKRGYKFDSSKINIIMFIQAKQMSVTSSQINFEFNHLMDKLKERDTNKFRRMSGIKKIETHPIFNMVSGKIETWEKA